MKTSISFYRSDQCYLKWSEIHWSIGPQLHRTKHCEIHWSIGPQLP